MENKTQTYKYFAAANGYSGFRSYFDSVFSALDSDMIFILKGGPGTGKSSFMKKMHRTFSHSATRCDLIYCSSDPNSLDGVILFRENKKIAIIDGTAPHEKDTSYPGAKDSIINLGDGWNGETLRAVSEEIVEIGKRKKNHYSRGYFLLNLAGRIYFERMKMARHSTDQAELNSIVTKLIDNICETETKVKRSVMLESAFCKYGLYRIGEIGEVKNRITLNKNGFTEYIILNKIKERLEQRNDSLTVIPSPLDDSLTDAVVTDGGWRICISDNEDTTLDVNNFCHKVDTASKDYDKYLEKLYSSTIEEAKNEFSLASDQHFSLEEIYKTAMDYSIIDKKAEECENIINKLF